MGGDWTASSGAPDGLGEISWRRVEGNASITACTMLGMSSLVRLSVLLRLACCVVTFLFAVRLLFRPELDIVSNEMTVCSHLTSSGTAHAQF